MKPIRIASVEAFSFRVPVQMPIKVAFGTFRDRPFVLVRVTDADGAEGWGEVWANWPAVGAEHRARLAVDIGERLIGKTFESPQDLFHKLTASPVLRVLQPDVTKWGGITGNWEVARRTVAAGKRYCPHYFGGGISLMASLQLLAAAGGEGLLEFDCHPNVGREAVVGDLLPVRAGRVPVPPGAGLGAAPDLDLLARYRTWAGEAS